MFEKNLFGNCVRLELISEFGSHPFRTDGNLVSGSARCNRNPVTLNCIMIGHRALSTTRFRRSLNLIVHTRHEFVKTRGAIRHELIDCGDTS